MKILPILMTASVSTRGMKGAAFSAEDRERMYLETLRFYLSVFPRNQPIVFAENSGWNLEAIRSQVPVTDANRVEFISLDPALFDVSRGKGYNEILLVNATSERSVAIRCAGSFLKVTGRYPIYNLPHYLDQARAFFAAGGEFFGDMKDHRIYDWIGGRNAWTGHALWTVMFAATVDFYRRTLSNTFDLCNDYAGDYVEIVWYEVMKRYRAHPDAKVRLRFDEDPACGGLQGSENKSLFFAKDNRSTMARFKHFVRNFTRRHVRWLWI